MISKMINGQEKPVSNSGDSLGPSVTLNGNPLSFSKDTAGLSSNTVITLEPIQAGTGDPSPSNVRAISGYNSVELVACGKNLWSYGEISASVFQNIDVSIPAGIYTLSANVVSSDTDSDTCRIDFTLLNGDVITSQISRGSGAYISVTLLNVAIRVTIYAGNSWAHSQDDTLNITNIQLELGSTATAYEPYNPATDLSIAMPGTVYGGTLDVESGELTITKKSVKMEDLGWWLYNSVFASAAIDDIKLSTYGGTSYIQTTQLKTVTSGNSDSHNTDDNLIYEAANSKSLFARCSYAQTASDFTSLVTGQILVYELATPITYQLTPHQVALLQGANVVTTNGTSISLTHRQGEIAAQEDLISLAESVNEMDKGSIRVVSESSETYGSILTKLASMIDPEKITRNAKIEVINPDGLTLIYILGLIDSTGAAYFYNSTSGTTNLAIDRLTMIPNGTGTKYTQQVTSSGFSSTNHTSTSFSGTVVFYY